MSAINIIDTITCCTVVPTSFPPCPHPSHHVREVCPPQPGPHLSQSQLISGGQSQCGGICSVSGQGGGLKACACHIVLPPIAERPTQHHHHPVSGHRGQSGLPPLQEAARQPV